MAVLLVVACSGTGGSDDGSSAGGADAPRTGARQGRPTPAPRHLTLTAVGDILLHAPVIASGRAYAGGAGYDFDPMFDDVRDVISAADLAICHQETPISADNRSLSPPGSMTFNAPREIATALRNAGFDACDTASNHTWDRGLDGVRSTLDVLDAAGIGHAGSARDQREADTPPIYDAKGVRIGHLALTYAIYNTAVPDARIPPEAPWLRSMSWPALGPGGILAMARALRARGAELVVVSMHWGDEYVHQPTAQQRELARELLASPDVDLILGDHVHVVQPCERIGEKYVAYGMGNFLSNQSPSQDRSLDVDSQDGSIVTFSIDEVAPGRLRTTRMTYVPTWVVVPGHRIVKATPDAQPDSYRRTVASMNLLGPGACDAQPAF